MLGIAEIENSFSRGGGDLDFEGSEKNEAIGGLLKIPLELFFILSLHIKLAGRGGEGRRGGKKGREEGEGRRGGNKREGRGKRRWGSEGGEKRKKKRRRMEVMQLPAGRSHPSAAGTLCHPLIPDAWRSGRR
jgi:hypothetical protein